MSENQSAAQMHFIQMIKNKLPNHVSLPEQIASLLNIGDHSAYRRIRGEKVMSLDEVLLLANHFEISLELLNPKISNDQVWFSFKTLDNKSFTFEQYLQSQIDHLERISKAKEKEMIYSAKDLPVFHYYHFDELAAFKIFVWKKAIMGLEEYQDRQFSIDTVNEDQNIVMGKMALERYIAVPSVEIWNDETPHSVLRQIHFYYDMGVFKNKKEALVLVDQFMEMMNHLEKQAEVGHKFHVGDNPSEYGSTYKLYNNEVVLCDNSIFAVTDDQKGVFITHNTLNYMFITNRDYCDTTQLWLNNLMKRSTLISSASEKARTQFFNTIKEKVEVVRKRIK
ncbi:MAG: hypothetical protein SGJ10_10800 [Bacteroidota bacterium]|nr:hypothetical protein [Bacteroidota bacterium]